MHNFLNRINKTSYCWEWIGSKNKKGYGVFWFKGKMVRAHRFSYEQAYGPIHIAQHVLHYCDNTSCVNPEHLFIGTAQDNIQDKVRKDRQAKGSAIPSHKLIENDVIEIKALYSTGKYTMRDLGGIFCISCSRISDIINNKSWRHVK